MKRVLSLAAFMFALAAGVLVAADAGKPNILFIVGDDMGYADEGFQGCQDIPTPHLDALAKASMRSMKRSISPTLSAVRRCRSSRSTKMKRGFSIWLSTPYTRRCRPMICG